MLWELRYGVEEVSRKKFQQQTRLKQEKDNMIEGKDPLPNLLQFLAQFLGLKNSRNIHIWNFIKYIIKCSLQ